MTGNIAGRNDEPAAHCTDAWNDLAENSKANDAPILGAAGRELE